MKLIFKAIVLIVISVLAIIYLTYGESGRIEPLQLTNVKAAKQSSADTLTLLSINMAHGRGDGGNQIFQSNELIKSYVEKIGQLIKRENADVVALQESDAPSWWSGNFSHVNRVAELSSMRYVLQGKHVNGLGLHYGASLITKLDATNAQSETFDMSIPTFSKGFVVSTMKWGDLEFDVVSLHLDFAKASVRKKQLDFLAEKLKARNLPLVILGDFNTDLTKEILPEFMQTMNLKTWKPEDTSIVTFPSHGNARIDWALVSPVFEIVDHVILDDIVSDHKAVRVLIKKNP